MHATQTAVIMTDEKIAVPEFSPAAAARTVRTSRRSGERLLDQLELQLFELRRTGRGVDAREDEAPDRRAVQPSRDAAGLRRLLPEHSPREAANLWCRRPPVLRGCCTQEGART